MLESQRTFRSAIDYMTREREFAAMQVELKARAGVGEQDITRFLAERYPELELTSPFTIAPLAPQDEEIALASRVRIRASYLKELENQVRRRALMFLGEGSFFFSLILVGVYLIHSTLQREVALKLQQSNFVSAVTHELKSPLASLRLYIQTFQMGRVDPGRTGTYYAHMSEDVDRLEALVENLLEAAKLESRGTRLNPEELELGEELESILAGHKRKLAEYDVECELGIPEESLWIQADRQALRIVMNNLLDNAIKYSQAPRRIWVRVAQIREWALIEVRDNGIGVAQEDVFRIFEKFYRVGDEMVREVKGTGLGLFLVAGLIEAHEGRVEAISQGPGTGTTLRVWLPLLSRASVQSTHTKHA